MAVNRGTKREDPETGKKFYDLNKDPIVSPYTGKSYPRSYFETNGKARAAERDEEEEEEIPDVEGVEDVEDIGEDESDVFLEEEDDEEENLGFDGGSDER